MTLPILYIDEHMIAIQKPHGLLVHRSGIASDADAYALQLLRDQVGEYVYPVHRLDRKTAGVLLFALSQEAARALGESMMSHQCEKVYHAVVRGYFLDEPIHLDYDLTDLNGRVQSAVTDFRLIERYEIPVPFGQHDTSRYSLVECRPLTGRYHQIRKHLAHLRHPIIADRPHGCNKQNRLWKERWQMTTMLLQAMSISLPHPISDEPITIENDYSDQMRMAIDFLNSENIKS